MTGIAPTGELGWEPPIFPLDHLPSGSGLEDLSFSVNADSAPLQVDGELVARVFEGVYFKQVPNLIDPDAYQTGIRGTELSPDSRVFEFDMWIDKEGTTRRRLLRIEVGYLSSSSQIDRYDYELDTESGTYVAVDKDLSISSGQEKPEDKKE
jgi:hypothetical protein